MPAAMGSPALRFLVLVGLAVAEVSALKVANATRAFAKSQKIAALQRSALTKPPVQRRDEEGHHFLHKAQLEPITSIHCLQEKQRNPNHACSDVDEVDNRFAGAIDMGHFPNWQDKICYSNKEYFCDMSTTLKQEQRESARERLRLFNERTMVNCGEFSPEDDQHSKSWYDPDVPVHLGRHGLERFRPFNLAVIVADEWPSTERDSKSMEYFGRIVMAQWGLTSTYNGVDQQNHVNQFYDWKDYHRNCPNAAVLFILPRYHQAYVVSPSDKFISMSRGGPEVVAAILFGLDHGGVEEAVVSGIDQIEKIIKVTSEQKPPEPTASYQFERSKTQQLAKDDAAWVWTIRLAYVLVILFAVVCTTAFVVYVLFAEKTSDTRRNYVDMNGSNGRRVLSAAYT